MVRLVLDTNVVAKWFLREEGSDRAETFLRELERGTARVLVPASLFYELSNVLWVRRRDGIDQEAAAAIWSELIQLPLEVVDATELLPQAMGLSFDLSISPYDAVFVVLAQTLGCDLITADGPLWTKTHTSCPWVKQL